MTISSLQTSRWRSRTAHSETLHPRFERDTLRDRWSDNRRSRGRGICRIKETGKLLL